MKPLAILLALVLLTGCGEIGHPDRQHARWKLRQPDAEITWTYWTNDLVIADNGCCSFHDVDDGKLYTLCGHYSVEDRGAR